MNTNSDRNKRLIAQSFRRGRDTGRRPLRFATVSLSALSEAVETGVVSAVLDDIEITNPARQIDLEVQTEAAHQQAIMRVLKQTLSEDGTIANPLGFDSVCWDLALFAVLAIKAGRRPTPSLASVVRELFAQDVCAYTDDRVALATRINTVLDRAAKAVSERGVVVLFNARKVRNGELPIKAIAGVEPLGDEEFDKLAELQVEVGIACPC